MCAFNKLLKNIKSFIFNERRQGTSAKGRYSQVLSSNGSAENCQLLPPNWPEEEFQLLPLKAGEADPEPAMSKDTEGESRSTSPKGLEESRGSERHVRNIARTSSTRQANGPLTPLMKFAIAAGNREVVKSLLDRGESPNALDRDGNTALMLAARKGLAEICSILLEAGADSELRDAKGRTALEIAEDLNHYDVVKVLKPLSGLLDDDLDNLFSEENWEEEQTPAILQEQDDKINEEVQQSMLALATFESKDDGEDWDEELLFADVQEEKEERSK